MKVKDIAEALEHKPRTIYYEPGSADWVFSSLHDQYQFVMLLVAVLEQNGYQLSDPPEGDGEVQRIDYLYLKQYEGFEIFVYWDFKVELAVFRYA